MRVNVRRTPTRTEGYPPMRLRNHAPLHSSDRARIAPSHKAIATYEKAFARAAADEQLAPLGNLA